MIIQWMFSFVLRGGGTQSRSTLSVEKTLGYYISNVTTSLFVRSSMIGVRCQLERPHPRCRVVSDLFRRFPDFLESQSIRPNRQPPSPLIKHVTHLTGPYPRPPPAHRSNINTQPPQSSLCTRPWPPHSRYQTMVLPTSPTTTLET